MTEEITQGSGNVFEDLGFENSAEHTVKADLAIAITEIFKKRELTQAQAAKLIGASQPDISNIKNGRLSGFTLDRLCAFLLRLDRHIEVKVSKPRSVKKRGLMEAVAA